MGGGGKQAVEESISNCSSPPSSKRVKAKKMTIVLEEIVAYNILPRLPFRSLCRFTAACKDWNMLISGGGDPLFAKLRPGCTITSSRIARPNAGFAFLNKHRDISFLPALAAGPSDIPTPLPLLGLRPNGGFGFPMRIVTSASGLLCLLCFCWGGGNAGESLFLCNPAAATVGHHVPVPPQVDTKSSLGLGLGLALTGSSQGSYILALPVQHGAVYKFKMFSSRCQSLGWTDSNQDLEIKDGDQNFWPAGKSVSTHRCLYWYCREYIIYYHFPSGNAVGHIRLPPPRVPPQSTEDSDCGPPCNHDYQDIGICGNLVTLAQLFTDGSFNIWMLHDEEDDNKYWEQIYRVRLDCIEASNKLLFSNLSERWRSQRTLADYLISKPTMQPLPFLGGNLLLFKWILNSREAAFLSFDTKTRMMIEFFVGDLTTTCLQLYFGETLN